MRRKESLLKDKKGQANTVMAILIGGITVIIGLLIFVQVYAALPIVGPTVIDEPWEWYNETSATWTKQLNNTNLVNDTAYPVKVYNSSATLREGHDYAVNYGLGQIVNITHGITYASTGETWANGTYSVDYKYEESGVIATKASIRTIFYSSIGLVIIGFLVLAAVFILSVVGRLRGAGGGE